MKPERSSRSQNSTVTSSVGELNDTDREIVDSVRAGNPRSYAMLVDRHKDRAMTLAVRLIRSREEAEEIVQDAFLRAYRNLDQFRGEAKFSTWFYRILYNLCMTRVARRRGNLVTLEVDAGKMADSAVAGEEMISALDRIEQEERSTIIASEIENLPEKFKTLLTFFYVQEMSYKEICSVLGIPLGTLKTNLFRGRNLLRMRVLTRLKDEVKVT